jgi:hypothetical protein
MGKFGEVLGWIAAVCYFVSVANYFVKWLFRAQISKLPKENKFRGIYQTFMKLLTKYHRWFGMAAGAFALVHLCWQLTNVRLSYSGVLAAALMVAAAVLGMVVAFAKKGKLVKAHRPVALAILAVIIFHLITKL